MKISIREWIKKFNNGDFNSADANTQVDAGWYDWFCRDSSLRNKTIKLAPKIKKLAQSSKIDIDQCYVWFSNKYPIDGHLYDTIHISDIITEEILWTIVPASGHTNVFGQSEVWGNVYDTMAVIPIVTGSWKQVLDFFGI
jgi:hypothetical protein